MWESFIILISRVDVLKFYVKQSLMFPPNTEHTGSDINHGIIQHSVTHFRQIRHNPTDAKFNSVSVHGLASVVLASLLPIYYQWLNVATN